ncbi:MAG: hypothetical protein ACM3JH_14820 [Acidithiobacillales bacterium]
MIPSFHGRLNLKGRSSLLRGFCLTAVAVGAISAQAREGGLDPATEARVSADLALIRQADAERKSVFLRYGSTLADRYRNLQEFRDRRRKAVIDAADALLAVRGSFPKERWKSIVEGVAAEGPERLLVEQALKELPAVVADEARLKTAGKALKELADAVQKSARDRASGRKKLLSILAKESSTRDDVVSKLASFDEAQSKLDEKLAGSTGALQQALTETEWAELVRRISGPPGGGSGKN